MSTPQGQVPTISPLERPKIISTDEKTLQSYADRPQLWPSPSKSSDFFRRSTSSSQSPQQPHARSPSQSSRPSLLPAHGATSTAVDSSRSKSDHLHQRPPKTTTMRRRFTNASRRSVTESFGGRKRSSTTNGRVESSEAQEAPLAPVAAPVSAVQQQQNEAVVAPVLSGTKTPAAQLAGMPSL